MTELLKSFPKYFIILCLVSCSVATPEIREKKWDIKVTRDQKNNVIHESLSLFVNCYDEDGENDVDRLYIIDDSSGIYWELDESTWLDKRVGEDRWIGSNSIIMPDRSPIPRKKLKIHVRDRSGEYAEDNLFITKSDIDAGDLIFPELGMNEDSFRVLNYPKAKIFIYTGSGSFLFSGVIDSNFQTFETIFGRNREEVGEDIYYYISVESKDLTLESGPW